MNLPNKLSILRIILVPVFIIVFYWSFNYHYLVACAVFCAAAITDFLDGYIARKYNLITDLGKFLDSSADKVLVLTVLVLFVSNENFFTPLIGSSILGGIGVSIIVAREIMVSCLRMVAASKGCVMAADMFGKLKTTTQDIFIAVLLVAVSFTSDFGNILRIIAYVLFGLCVLFTIASGLNYFIKNKQVFKEKA